MGVPDGKRGIPWWVILICSGISVLFAAVVGFFVLFIAAFSCDSGVKGCETVGVSFIGIYAAIAVLGIVGLTVLGIAIGDTTSAKRGIRIASLVVLLLIPFIAGFIAFISFIILSEELTGHSP